MEMECCVRMFYVQFVFFKNRELLYCQTSSRYAETLSIQIYSIPPFVYKNAQWQYVGSFPRPISPHVCIDLKSFTLTRIRELAHVSLIILVIQSLSEITIENSKKEAFTLHCR